VAVTGMATLLTFITPEVELWLQADLWWRISRVSVLVFAGLASFMLLIGLLGMRLREIKDPSLH